MKRQIAMLACLVSAVFGMTRPAPAQPYLLAQSSQPPGIFSSQSNYLSAGAVAQTLDAPLTASGYGFVGWTINGQRAAAASGQSAVVTSFVMSNDTTAVAWYVPVAQDTNQNGIADYLELYYYNSTTNPPNSDSDGDGFTFQSELSRDYDPVIPDITTNGGAILRLSDAATFTPGTNLYYYQIESQPLGVVAPASGYVLPGTPVQTPDVAYGSTSGQYFGYWTVNGVRQSGAAGASLTTLILPMTNDETAIAVFFPAGDAPIGGLADWYQWFWFGGTNQNAGSNPTGDGFTLFSDLQRDYSPVIPNVTTNGGAILRLSDAATFTPGTNLYYYQIESQPLGVVAPTSGYVLPGTPVQTPDVAYGNTSGQYFGYWTVNGVRQSGAAGASLTTLILPMTNDETAIAVFFPAGDAPIGGLADWYQWFWFGGTNQNAGSNPTGDGFTLFSDLQRDYSPVIPNVTTNGGAILRLSDAATLNPPAIVNPPTVTIAFLNGQVIISWSAGGILQSAMNADGPYTDVIGATSPYAITPTFGQMFFRVVLP